MANHKSAIKRVSVTAKKNLRNRIITSRMKTAVKSFEQVVAKGEKSELESSYTNAVSMVDKAASKGVIHKNAASRKKAQLTVKYAAAK
ncbi:MAG: 30S ribosomal protein S20 [Clostridia bacterium]|nr:30S ribosomal protein S20 [Clostridia bacterium]